MVRRAIAGFLGALVGVLPLALVNLLVNGAATLDTGGATVGWIAQYATLFGALALLVGVALGGWLAGWVGGRQGGMAGGAVAGMIAAVLYGVSVILLVVGGAKQGWGPPIAALHPIRASAVIAFIALLLLGVALMAARLAGVRRARGRQAVPPGAPYPRSARYSDRRQVSPQPGPSVREPQPPGWGRPPYDSRPSAHATARSSRSQPMPPRYRE